MCISTGHNAFWPPKGWQYFNSILKSSGQSFIKDPLSGCINGFIYQIESLPVYHDNDLLSAVHDIRISGWEYNILGESDEYPILSFLLQDRLDQTRNKESHISQIKVREQNIFTTKQTAQGSCKAAFHFMKQIHAGDILDIETILTSYGIHPTQQKNSAVSHRAQNKLFQKSSLLIDKVSIKLNLNE
jgi:hypothetical protein